tara:strand:+ start:2228 stop:2482 length:255 start_codon:yes stop_codon:yes gene_type:complete
MVKYELWDMVSYGHGEPLIPFTLIEKSDSFEKIYTQFNKLIKSQPCVILINEGKPKIYESPDGGKTIFERDFGNYDLKSRKRIK